MLVLSDLQLYRHYDEAGAASDSSDDSGSEGEASGVARGRIAPAVLLTGEPCVCSATIPDSAALEPSSDLVDPVRICWLARGKTGNWGQMVNGSGTVAPSPIFPHGGGRGGEDGSRGIAKLTSAGAMAVGPALIFTWLRRCQRAINAKGKGAIARAYADYAAKE